MNSTDKDDVIYAINKAEDAVGSVGSNLEELTNEVRRIDMGIGGPSGILDGLHQLNKNLKAIKWLLGALLLVSVFILLKK